MRTITQLENEIDRLIELRENICFIIGSLVSKVKYLKEIFQTEDEVCSKEYELTGSIKDDLESSVVSFLAGNSTYTDFDLREPEETEA